MQLRKEIKFETLHKSYKKKIIIGVVVLCILGSVLIFKTTRAKYRFTQSIPFVRGTINYKPSDLNVVAMYQENSAGNGWDSIDVAPSSGYKLNTTESKCEVNGTKDTNISISYTGGKLSVSNFTKKGTKCYIYFDKLNEETLTTILAKYTKAGERPNYETLTTDNSGKVFSLEDDDGTSYYFAGAVNNNWVKFAGFYWRIVRFNGDGTMRLIYSGDSNLTNVTLNDNGTATGDGTQIGTSAFNSSYNDNKCVGYRYTSGEVHGTGTASTIQEVIDKWYKTNIVDKGYSGKLDSDAGFCGDRDNYTNNTGTTAGGGIGSSKTYYGAYIRFIPSPVKINPTPTLKCKNTSDLYTVIGASKGNKSLTYSVGLITADEVNIAGTIYNTENSSYYLYTGQAYWTMSPSDNQNQEAYVYISRSVGDLRNYRVMYEFGVRPVINLRADTTFKSGGNGTASFPYEVI